MEMKMKLSSNGVLENPGEPESRDFTPSHYQQAIFDFVLNGEGNGFVDAKAGSGKTTTLVHCAQLISGEGIFCAFNRHIADELGRRLRGTTMTASTIHAIGSKAIRSTYGYRRTKVDNRKYFAFLKDLVNQAIDESRLGKTNLDATEVNAFSEEWPISDLNQLCNLARVNLVDVEDGEEVTDLCDHYGLTFHEKVYPHVQTILRMALEYGREVAKQKIDFADMLWLPYVENMHVEGFAWVFVDEAQDLNKAQLNLVKMSMAHDTRVLFVGDPHQAIYGFAGADASSVANIQREMQTTNLPLSVCYRCPKTHIELAQNDVPDIEARPGAPDGEIVNLGSQEEIPRVVKEGDLILCRVTAPLLGLCYKLIASGISAAVKGREIGKGLVKVIEDIEKRRRPFTKFLDMLREWEEDQIGRLQMKKGSVESAISAVQDKVECIEVMISASKATAYRDLIRAIEQLFAVDRPSVLLSTVHRAKGLENERVFILKPELMPFYRAKKDWQVQQEYNLRYVSFTRAKETLFLVPG